jgi:hypothetical protein
MALSIGAIIGIIFALAILGALGYIVYRYTKDSKKTYNEIQDKTPKDTTKSASGTCQDPAVGSRVAGSALAKTASLCKIDCDETSDCKGYEWNKGCSLFTQPPTAALQADGANCYAKA